LARFDKVHGARAGDRQWRFATREEAQRAADRHECEGYPNSLSIADGVSWLPPVDPEWWLSLIAVADRSKVELFHV